MSAPADPLTPRQQREAEYYDRFAAMHAVTELDFKPVLSDEHRPWSPHWQVCRLVREAMPLAGPTAARGRLLDFGCGMGRQAVLFAKLGYEVHGFDISEGNLAVARRLAEHYGLADHCHFRTMPAERLDFPDNHFDVVVGVDILHHVEVATAMREVTRVLRPDGVAIFKEPLRVPALEPLRESKLLMKLAPRDKSFEKGVHITDDERKLDRRDVRHIREAFGDVAVYRYSITQRLYRLIPARFSGLIGKLQHLDYHLMRFCPPLKHLGDVAVFPCRKPVKVSKPMRRAA